MKNKIIKYIILFSNLNKKKIKVLKENYFFLNTSCINILKLFVIYHFIIKMYQ
jgi:hypothetical protein